MSRRSLVGLGLGLGLALIACSSSSGGVAATPESACDDFVSALCNKLQECTPNAIAIAYKDANDCIARQKPQCVKAVNAPSTGATPSVVSDCAGAYRAATCDDFFAQPQACRTPAGALADGAPCGEAAQCTGRRCNKPTGSICGACAPRVPAGGDCKSTSDCEDTLICGPTKCVVPSKAGEACGGTAPCAAPLLCSKGTCGAGVGAGESCADGEACKSGLACEPSSKVCQELSFAKPGEACGLVSGSIVGCAGGAVCKDTCVAPAADGASCSAGGAPCQAPASCLNGVCTIPDPGSCK
jgi:hypothetical protein